MPRKPHTSRNFLHVYDNFHHESLFWSNMNKLVFKQMDRYIKRDRI